MFGIYKMDEGEIEYEGEKVNIPTPLDALNRGIAMVHQELQPIPARTAVSYTHLDVYKRQARARSLSSTWTASPSAWTLWLFPASTAMPSAWSSCAPT